MVYGMSGGGMITSFFSVSSVSNAPVESAL